MVRMTVVRVSVYMLYPLAHSGRVTALKFNAPNNWLLSASRDKSFEWYCTSTGRRRGNFKTQSWCTAVEYPLI